MTKQSFKTIGLMSGSSLDGLDLCCVQFDVIDNQQFDYNIIYTDYINYTDDFRQQLKNASTLSGFELAKLHINLGRFFGESTLAFIKKNNIDDLDLICSHGQTIFHQPDLGFSTQIGCGATIAQITKTKTIADLRMSDVAAGGQGAPIVPIAEKYLFTKIDAFLNIGGICNMSFHSNKNILAYDICAGNTLLNYLAQQQGKNFDKNGNLASQGIINYQLLESLNQIEFCHKSAPKSLGTEHVVEAWIQLVNQYENSIEDKLATCVEHIAMQIQQQIQLQNFSIKQLMITGGGAHNQFLIERIQHHINSQVLIPDKETIDNKEALAIAFFGLLRLLEIPNCLSSVTGAKNDVVGGAIYL